MRTVPVAVNEDTPLPVAAARQGRPEAWEVLFRRYQLPLYAYAMELLRNEQSSLDVVQETFVRASRHLARLREDSRFGSWLFGIAHQLVCQHWRREGRSPWVDDALPLDHPATDPEPGDALVRAEDAEALYEAINALPEAQRSVILLHFLEDFSVAEIAEVTHASPGTVKSRLHYARKALRERLIPSLR